MLPSRKYLYLSSEAIRITFATLLDSLKITHYKLSTSSFSCANKYICTSNAFFFLPLNLCSFESVEKPADSGSGMATKFSSYTGYAFLSAGLCCGLSGLAAGMCIGVVGDAGVRAVGQQEKLFVGVILILIFAEALGLYGLIVALILSQNTAFC